MRSTTSAATLAAATALAGCYRDSWIAVHDDVPVGANLEDLVVVARAEATGGHRRVEHCAEHPDMSPRADPGLTIIDVTSPDYPDRLRRVTSRPLLLYVRGRLPDPDAKALAIVGSRTPTRAATDAAHDIAAAVATYGLPIISGLAAGVDTAAHEGALSVNGCTVAVMGTGPDHVFPPQNAELAARIARYGATITQFAPGQGPTKTTFPARNALIAGLSDASLLIELDERSGTRIEANHALAQHKPVWLWAPIMRTHAWAHRFAARDGVEFVDTIDDILHRLATLTVP